YGVRFSFTGHDMHGLAIGPDGRLYFSFGDRGAHVKTPSGQVLAFPDEGAVFRCELDGSNMEVVHRGLRNPQELAFDNHGNLFTGDNDSDQGDRERWVYVVEGGDSGWRVGWQHNPLGKDNNPWLAENMWQPRAEGKNQPAAILSPILNIPDGPSGITHYPGTGLPQEFAGAFFVCGFKGSSARSAVSMLKVKEQGASFVVEQEPAIFVGEVQATDIDFGPDSKIYFSEWGEGWEGTGRGRLFRMQHAAAQQEQAAPIAEVKKLLGEGFAQRSSEELAKLLAHKDQRVRLRAQWALAAKPDGAEKFLAVASKGTDPLARLHGIWGLEHMGRLAGYKYPRETRQVAALLEPLLPLLKDSHEEVRAQVAQVLGDNASAVLRPQANAGAPLPNSPRVSHPWASALLPLLKDAAARVRFFAAQSLGDFGGYSFEAGPALIEMLRENADQDQYIRHAGVMALSRGANLQAIEAAAKHESPSVRVAALLAMQRMEMRQIALFVTDQNPELVKEAARAINDTPIPAAYGALAKLIEKPARDAQLMLRVINANFRAGTPAAALGLAKYAADESAAEPLRLEALKALSTWPKPFPRDRVMGVYRPLADRDPAPAIAGLRAALPRLFAAKSANVLMATVDAVSALNIVSEAPALHTLLSNPKVPAKVRSRVLETLASFDDPKLPEVIKLALLDKDAGLRVAASTMLGKLDPDEAARQLGVAFDAARVTEKKSILTALGALKSPGADKVLAGLLADFRAGKVPAEVQLELLEAAARRGAQEVKAKLAQYQASLPPGDLLAAFEPALAGGDREAGEKIFKEHAVAQCFRCHKVDGSGGEAGPDLTGIGAKKDRKYLLESLILPGAQIAEGFQSILVTLKNGDIHAGVVKSETADQFTLQMPVPDVPPVTIKKADVQARENGPSGMPPGMGDLLTRREIRDLMEYVASLKTPERNAQIPAQTGG
ncbi:MAG: HEAT repeat domain-containing protein, partial [Verrucomicrobiota bacterium]|nr:HEAT repeat domain-containing protein [Verrucomicrobiota bacterium]